MWAHDSKIVTLMIVDFNIFENEESEKIRITENQNCDLTICKNTQRTSTASNQHFTLSPAKFAVSQFAKSSSQNPQNPIGIRCGDLHIPSAFFCCWRRLHLHKRYIHTPQGYQVPNKSQSPSGKDCIGRSDKAPISNLA